ncbi:hypothetical protein DEU56DRAFT_761667 [Suillus clintonianus]|uniref:uncharacterized protein n=1 Tax=Suillus clintonianus TaxID=1904413 RepID=UPI001B8782C8|nr:uncharacterized protein DEU56DRAFT_761667 [Suillus clintonianus]KAG2115474.1 hypothetical protein DEU56DRAFT_761667 [Suillus clintonianus]
MCTNDVQLTQIFLFFIAVLPPRAVASPKKKRSKHKGSDASKTGLPKKSRAADTAEVPSMVPLVSLGLTGVEAANDAPRRSGRSNAGTGGRNAQLEKIGLALQSKPQTHELTSLGPNVPVNPQAPEPHHKGRKKGSKAVPPPYSLVSNAPDASAMDITGPSLTLQQPGRRFGFSPASTADIVHPGTAETTLQASDNPYVAVRMKVAEQRARNAVAEQRALDAIAEQRAQDAIAEKRAREAIAEQQARDAVAENPVVFPRSVFLEHNLDPALRQQDDTNHYSYGLGWTNRMPDIFRVQLPLSCLALVAAVFNCVLDGLAKNGHGKSYPNFSSKDYSPIYNQMLVFLEDILDDAHHGPRLTAQLREWAAAGWAAALNLEGVVEAKHDHLKILLD